MRILLLTDADAFAGTERHMLDLAEGLRAAGAVLQVACPAEAPLAARVRANGIAHVAVEKRGTIDRVAIGILTRLLRSGEIDVIHAHNGRTALQAAMAKQFAGRGRLVVTQHFITPTRASRRGPKRVVSQVLHAWVSRRIDHTIAISTAVRDAIVRRADCPPERLTLVPNGIADPVGDALPTPSEVRAKLGVPADAPLIVCAARLQPEKGVGTLVAAMAQVVERHPDVRCVIAGRGDDESSLRAQIEGLGLTGRVDLLGFRDDVRAIMAAGDVFVLPAPAEPFGLVLLEAMALRKPVVAVRAGGPLDIVEDGVTGLLTTPGAADELAAALSELLSDPQRRSKSGEAGRRRFEERFTAEQMTKATLRVYRLLTGQGEAKSTGSAPERSSRPSASAVSGATKT